MDTIFTKIKTSTGDQLEIIEAKGEHFYQGAYNAGAQGAQIPYVFMFHVLALITRNNGKPVDVEYLRQLPIADIQMLIDVMSSQMFGGK